MNKKKIDVFCEIPLWDKCMLLIMVILLLECSYLALFQQTGNAIDASLEVVLRAAISTHECVALCLYVCQYDQRKFGILNRLLTVP